MKSELWIVSDWFFLKSVPFPQTVRWESSQHHNLSSHTQSRASRDSPGAHNFLPPHGAHLYHALWHCQMYQKENIDQTVTSSWHIVVFILVSQPEASIVSISSSTLWEQEVSAPISWIKSCQSRVGLTFPRHSCEAQRLETISTQRVSTSLDAEDDITMRRMGQRGCFEVGWKSKG